MKALLLNCIIKRNGTERRFNTSRKKSLILHTVYQQNLTAVFCPKKRRRREIKRHAVTIPTLFSRSSPYSLHNFASCSRLEISLSSSSDRSLHSLVHWVILSLPSGLG
ncbi:unnamed protein product [Rhodiola kirilowii]